MTRPIFAGRIHLPCQSKTTEANRLRLETEKMRKILFGLGVALMACTDNKVVGPESAEPFKIINEGDKTWAFITLEKKSDLTYFVFVHSLDPINIEGEVTDSLGRSITSWTIPISNWDNFNAYGKDANGLNLYELRYEHDFFRDEDDYYGKYNFKATVTSYSDSTKVTHIEFDGVI